VVVHRELGHSISNYYGPGSGRVWLHGLRCNGNESSLVNCSHSGWGVGSVYYCGHSYDVSISCANTSSTVGKKHHNIVCPAAAWFLSTGITSCEAPMNVFFLNFQMLLFFNFTAAQSYTVFVLCSVSALDCFSVCFVPLLYQILARPLFLGAAPSIFWLDFIKCTYPNQVFMVLYC